MIQNNGGLYTLGMYYCSDASSNTRDDSSFPSTFCELPPLHSRGFLLSGGVILVTVDTLLLLSSYIIGNPCQMPKGQKKDIVPVDTKSFSTLSEGQRTV